MTNGIERPEDRTADLAETLGMTAPEFAELFGAGWTENEAESWHDYDRDPSGVGAPVTPWLIAGTPPQLMLRVFPHGVFLSPVEGLWRQGTQGLAYQPARPRYLPREELVATARGVAEDVLRRRRRTFRYCRYCRTSTPPELRVEDDVCMGCGSAWLGVVY